MTGGPPHGISHGAATRSPVGRMASSAYRGRFAPSPTGPLHLGSLSTALASFLDARAHGGAWLLRIEDIDPPREQRGATGWILASLRAHALQWDETVLYQHDRGSAYVKVIGELLRRGVAFHCTCSRQELQRRHGSHAPACPQSRTPPAGECAIRLRAHGTPYGFHDLFLGEVELPAPEGTDDFVIRRRDGLYAYQLAVVVDDGAQGVAEVVRGFERPDALRSGSPRQPETTHERDGGGQSPDALPPDFSPSPDQGLGAPSEGESPLIPSEEQRLP